MKIKMPSGNVTVPWEIRKVSEDEIIYIPTGHDSMPVYKMTVKEAVEKGFIEEVKT